MTDVAIQENTKKIIEKFGVPYLPTYLLTFILTYLQKSIIFAIFIEFSTLSIFSSVN